MFLLLLASSPPPSFDTSSLLPRSTLPTLLSHPSSLPPSLSLSLTQADKYDCPYVQAKKHRQIVATAIYLAGLWRPVRAQERSQEGCTDVGWLRADPWAITVQAGALNFNELLTPVIGASAAASGRSYLSSDHPALIELYLARREEVARAAGVVLKNMPKDHYLVVEGCCLASVYDF